MKCSNCGGQYKTRELKCPYCGTENLIGHLWMKERSEAELEYEKARKEMGKKGSIYVVNRVVNRALLISTGMFVIMMLVAWVLFFVTDLFGDTKKTLQGKDMQTTMQQYYDDKDYESLYTYMNENDLFSKDHLAITQAALLYRSYQTYLNDKFTFMELTKEQLQERDYEIYHLTKVLEDSIEIYNVEIGVYDEQVVANEEQYEEYRTDIEAFWIGSLGLTEEQIAMLLETERANRSEAVESLVDGIVEKEAWR